MKKVLLVLIVVLGSGLSHVFAQEKKEKPKEKPNIEKKQPKESPKEELQKRIEKLTKQLGDDSYKTRENATKELEKIGKSAIPALKEASGSTDPEISYRAKAILKKIEEKLYGNSEKKEKKEKSIPLPPGLPPNVQKIFKKIIVKIGPGGKPQIIQEGQEEKKKIAGATVDEISPALRKHLRLKEKEGILIDKLKKDSLLAKAGVERYDIILKINDKKIEGIESFKEIMEKITKVDKPKLKIFIIREGTKKELIFPKIAPPTTPSSKEEKKKK